MSEIIVQNGLFHLRNGRMSYFFRLTGDGLPAHVYWGERLERLDSPLDRLFFESRESDYCHNTLELEKLPQEYPTWGHGDLRRGALEVTAADGSTAVDLCCEGYSITAEKPTLAGLPATFDREGGSRTLSVAYADAVTGLRVTLLYTVFDDCDVIARSARVENAGPRAVSLERVMSASVDLIDDRWELITLSGAWARERMIDRRPLKPGFQGVDSARGASSAQNNPFMALVRPGTDEFRGEAYGFALMYSGNFTALAEVGMYRMTRAQIGLNDAHFRWLLEPGETFTAPEALLAWSNTGLNGMSAQYHTLVRRHVVRGRYAQAQRPFLLNNWEATTFNFDEEKILQIARRGREAGLEMFVLDDGWFGHRDDDHSSLGDWTVNLKKLPHGMNGLADRIHWMGLKFGLWFEPEMVSPDSELYRAHPDWCLHQPDRTRTEGRWQLTLDMSRADVCEYVENAVAAILDSAAIDYVKWDMNRDMSPVGSALLPPERQAETAHRYMLGLYGVLERLTARFPHILFESCASGGNRFDLGMMYYMPQAWCSDNTDAGSRVLIQYGTSLVFPQSTMGAHVSHAPNWQTGRMSPLRTRVDVAMWGTFGYEMDLAELDADQLAETRADIAWVKAHRDLLLYGDSIRLLSPFEGDTAAWMVVAPDRSAAVVTAVRLLAHANERRERLRLAGLAPETRYRVEELDVVLTGQELMRFGLPLRFAPGDDQSLRFTLVAEQGGDSCQ